MSLTIAERPAPSAAEQPKAPATDSRRTWRAGWTAFVVTTLSRAVLATLGSLIGTSILPVLFGWHTAVVLSGSMEPRLAPGDIAVVRHVPVDKLSPGQVLLVHDPDHPGGLRLHRLIAVRPDGMLTLRGDANPKPDSTPVATSAVVGVASLHVPWIALPDYWLHVRRFGAVGISLLGAAALLGGAFLYRSPSQQQEDRNDDPGAKPTGPRRATTIVGRFRRPARARRRPHLVLRTRLLTVATVAALVLMSGLAPSAFAATIWFKTTVDAGNAWSATNYFSCTDAVQAAAPETYYRLADDGSTTTVADSSTAGAAGTYQGTGTTFGVAGACPRDNNPGVTLNGTSGWISTPNAATNPNNFTLEVWFKSTSTQGGDLISFGTSQTGTSTATQVDRAAFMTKTGALGFGMGGNSNNVVSGRTTYNDGQWHLLDAELSSSSGMTLYVDATDIATKGAIKSGLNQTGYWHIGYDDLSNMGNQAPTSNYFAGSLDEVAIYNTTLTAQQIKDHYYAS